MSNFLSFWVYGIRSFLACPFVLATVIFDGLTHLFAWLADTIGPEY